MSRSNYDKPFYVDVGTSIVAIRCASNHDVIVRYDHVWHPHTLKLAEDTCDRMNKEVEIGKPLRNCDVGTPQEQIKRWEEFCQEHHERWKPGKSLIAIQRCNCPCHEGNGCNYFIWAQLPYEKEGEE